MVDFGGGTCGSYGSQIEEHHAVRRSAASSMYRICAWVDARRAVRLLRYLLANDVARRRSRARHCTAVLTELAADRRSDRVLLTTAGSVWLSRHRAKDLAWMASLAGAFDVA
jgi:glycine cleavage system aminomethyltransferase T